jgi:hypothetical protein
MDVEPMAEGASTTTKADGRRPVHNGHRASRAGLVIRLADRRVTVTGVGDRTSPETTRLLDQPTFELSPAELADLVSAAIPGASFPRGPSTLLLPASWCYVHPFIAVQRRSTRALLGYALEEYLPLEIERLTCDFVRVASSQYLGVAVETDRVRPLLDALAARGVRVERITLDVLYAGYPTSGEGVLLWCDDAHVAVVHYAGRNLVQLRVVRVAGDLDDVEWCRRMAAQLQLGGGSNVAIAGYASPERRAGLARALGVQPEAVCDLARSNEATSTWRFALDLARDALAPSTRHAGLLRIWRTTAAMLLVALLILCAGLYVHRTRVEARLQRVAAWEGEVFAELLPNEPIPAGVALRLASERRRWEGLTLAEGPDRPASRDALDTLRAIVAALPADVRVDLQELRIEDQDVTLRGRLSDHRQAEQLAAAVGRLPGLECGAPRTHRLPEGGVEFFLHAQRGTAGKAASTAWDAQRGPPSSTATARLSQPGNPAATSAEGGP